MIGKDYLTLMCKCQGQMICKVWLTLMSFKDLLFLTLKAYMLSELNFLVYIKSCKYSMFYTNKTF